MTVKTFNLPDPGEGLVEAEVVEWKVAVGDTVKVNEIVLEIETAKSLVELPIPWAGTVHRILVDVGATIDVGTPIIAIDDGQGGDEVVVPQIPGETAGAAEAVGGGDAQEAILVGYGAKAGATARRARKGAGMPQGSGAASTPACRHQPSHQPSNQPSEQVSAEPAVPEPTTPAPRTESPSPAVGSGAPAGGRPKAKPPVRKLAKDLGIDLGDVTATGPDGVITRDDVTNHGSQDRRGRHCSASRTRLLERAHRHTPRRSARGSARCAPRSRGSAR